MPTSVIVPDALRQANPARDLVDRQSNKWSLLVIAVMAEQPIRYGALFLRIEGISQKMLSQTLRTLECDGLIERRVLASRVLAVEYRLSGQGESLAPLAIMIKEWAEGHAGEVVAANRSYAARTDQWTTPGGTMPNSDDRIVIAGN